MRYAAVEIDRIDHLVFTVADIDAPPPYSSPLNTLRLDHHEQNACSTPLDGTRPGSECRMKPRIDHTQFGSVTIDGKVFEHDVIIRLGGKVAKRKKRLSKAVWSCCRRPRRSRPGTRPREPSSACST
jgi:hypothetical protein